MVSLLVLTPLTPEQRQADAVETQKALDDFEKELSQHPETLDSLNNFIQSQVELRKNKE